MSRLSEIGILLRGGHHLVQIRADARARYRAGHPKRVHPTPTPTLAAEPCDRMGYPLSWIDSEADAEPPRYRIRDLEPLSKDGMTLFQ